MTARDYNRSGYCDRHGPYLGHCLRCEALAAKQAGAAAEPITPTPEPSPAVANYREGYRDGRFDTLSEVLGILASIPPAPGPYADAHRAIRALFTELARSERDA